MSCVLKAIVAVTDNWGIGKAGQLVVSSKADMKHFVACTTGHAIIMGRKTLDSFPGGRPLKNRRNIVLTRDKNFEREGVEVVHTVDEALTAVANEDEAWVIGGGEIYKQFLPHCMWAEVTKTHCTRDCDTFFPDLDDSTEWRLFGSAKPDEFTDGAPDLEFCTYKRRDDDTLLYIAKNRAKVLESRKKAQAAKAQQDAAGEQ